jgi:hypothetical protein
MKARSNGAPGFLFLAVGEAKLQLLLWPLAIACEGAWGALWIVFRPLYAGPWKVSAPLALGNSNHRGKRMPIGTIILIILVILLIGALPSWPYAAGWGAGPAGILGVVLIIVLILVLLGRI